VPLSNYSLTHSPPETHRLDAIPTCDRQTPTALRHRRAMQSVARVKSKIGVHNATITCLSVT